MLQRITLSLLSCCIMLTFPVAASYAATGPSTCQALQFSDPAIASSFNGNGSLRRAAAAVSTQLYPGQLEPQIRAMLKQHLAIKVLDWQASPHHQWPTEHQVIGDTWADVLRKILHPYHLQLVMHPNHSAVVRYRDR